MYLEQSQIFIFSYDMERERQFGNQIFEISESHMVDIVLIHGKFCTPVGPYPDRGGGSDLLASSTYVRF